MSHPLTNRTTASRRKRRAKLHVLRKKYNEAKSEETKTKIVAKVAKLAPWLSEDEFLLKTKPSK